MLVDSSDVVRRSDAAEDLAHRLTAAVDREIPRRYFLPRPRRNPVNLLLPSQNTYKPNTDRRSLIFEQQHQPGLSVEP